MNLDLLRGFHKQPSIMSLLQIVSALLMVTVRTDYSKFSVVSVKQSLRKTFHN